MANPQTEHGYTRIANSILEALARIRIAGEARQVLDVILRKTYGFQKAQDSISFSQFSLATGLSRPHIVRAVSKLVKINIITVTKKGNTITNIYRFNKDYSSWRPSTKKGTGVTNNGTNTVTNKGTKVLPIKVHTKESKETKKGSARFTPPTLERVSAYCKEKEYGISAAEFVAWNASKGWMIGKNQMKSWKSACLTWELRRKKDEKSGGVKWKTEN